MLNTNDVWQVVLRNAHVIIHVAPAVYVAQSVANGLNPFEVSLDVQLSKSHFYTSMFSGFE